MMAKILRQDTGELLGQIVELRGPVQSWIKDWPFKYWRHPDGKLRGYPAVPAPGQPMRAPASEVRFPVRNSASGEMEILVPAEFVDFMLNHTDLRK